MIIETDPNRAISTLQTDEEIRGFFDNYSQILNGNFDVAKSNILWCLGYYNVEVKNKWISALTASDKLNFLEQE